MKKKLLWISDYSINGTGYTMVAHNLLSYISNIYEIYFFIINNINPNIEQTKIKLNNLNIYSDNIYFNKYNESNRVDSLIGNDILQKILINIQPDIVFTLNDNSIIESQLGIILKYNKPCTKIAYIPIDVEYIPYNFLLPLQLYDYLFTMTPKSKNIIYNSGITTPIYVLPHSIYNNFKYLNITNKYEKQKLRQKYYPAYNFNINDIILININVNSIRKRLDYTIEAFYELYNKQISNIYLILKINIIENSIDLNYIINNLNNKYNIDLRQKIILDYNKYSLEDLNILYNISDLYLSTTSGEGWGYTAFEALQTSIYTLVPDNTSYSEYFPSELLIKTTTKSVNEIRYNKIVSENIIQNFLFLQGYKNNNSSINYYDNLTNDSEIEKIYNIDIFDSNLCLIKEFIKINLDNYNSFQIFIDIDSPNFNYLETFITKFNNLNLINYFTNYKINAIYPFGLNKYFVKTKIVDINNLVEKIIYYINNKDSCNNFIINNKHKILENLSENYIGKQFKDNLLEIINGN